MLGNAPLKIILIRVLCLKEMWRYLRTYRWELEEAIQEGRKKIFEPAMERLLSNIAEARQEESRSGKMYKGMGAACGIVISIVII